MVRYELDTRTRQIGKLGTHTKLHPTEHALAIMYLVPGAGILDVSHTACKNEFQRDRNPRSRSCLFLFYTYTRKTSWQAPSSYVPLAFQNIFGCCRWCFFCFRGNARSNILAFGVKSMPLNCFSRQALCLPLYVSTVQELVCCCCCYRCFHVRSSP